MTRYDQIKLFAADSRTHRDHAYTFMVLTEMWIYQGKPDSIELNVETLLQMLKTKRSTLFDWLRQLEQFGYLEWRRAANQREKSTATLYPNRTADTQLGQHVPDSDSTAPNRTVEQVGSLTQTGQHVPDSDGRHPNRTAEMPPERPKRGFRDLSTAAQPVLVYNNNHLGKNFNTCFKGDIVVMSDEKGVQGKKPPTARKPHRDRQTNTHPKTAFTESPLAGLSQFQEALSAEYPTADLPHYHARLLNWRDKSGAVPKRSDWLSTAKTFLLNDTRDGKLVTNLPIIKHLHYGNRNADTRTDTIIPQPAATERRRFGAW